MPSAQNNLHATAAILGVACPQPLQCHVTVTKKGGRNEGKKERRKEGEEREMKEGKKTDKKLEKQKNWRVFKISTFLCNGYNDIIIRVRTNIHSMPLSFELL